MPLLKKNRETKVKMFETIEDTDGNKRGEERRGERRRFGHQTLYMSKGRERTTEAEV